MRARLKNLYDNIKGKNVPCQKSKGKLAFMVGFFMVGVFMVSFFGIKALSNISQFFTF